VPYAQAGAAARPHPVLADARANGQLFVWHDPQGNPPPPSIAIPRIEGAFSDEWSDWTWDSIRIDGANCREVIDNVVDMAHFFYIHFAFPTYFKNVFEGHVATQYLQHPGRPDVPTGGEPGGTTRPALGGVVLRPVLHDRQPVATTTTASTSSRC
jgi:3-ketosteroid 9alpha-monooxygenase subunit A